MIQAFKNKSTGIVAVIILAIAVHIHFFFEPVQVCSGNGDGILSVFLSRYISTLNSSVVFTIYIGFLLLEAILLNLALNNLKMFKPRGYTIAMSYVLLSALIPQWHNLSSGFIANILAVWLFFLLCKLYNNSSVKSLLFNSGLLTAIICILYTPFIALFVFALFALAIMRPFNIKEWLIFIIGCLTPLYFLLSYFFLTDKLYHIKDFVSSIIIYPNTNIPIVDKLILIKIGYGLFIFILGFISLSMNRNQMLIQARRYWNLMLIYLLLITAIPFVFPHSGIETFVICIIPLSSFIANIFATPQKNLWIINLLFLIFIGIIAHTNWMLIKI